MAQQASVLPVAITDETSAAVISTTFSSGTAVAFEPVATVRHAFCFCGPLSTFSTFLSFRRCQWLVSKNPSGRAHPRIKAR